LRSVASKCLAKTTIFLLHDHGRRQKYFQEEQRRHFACPFQVANDAMQMDVHKTLWPFYTTKKMPHITATVTKNALRWQQ